jgi:hypothetical protein
MTGRLLVARTDTHWPSYLKDKNSSAVASNQNISAPAIVAAGEKVRDELAAQDEKRVARRQSEMLDEELAGQ